MQKLLKERGKSLKSQHWLWKSSFKIDRNKYGSSGNMHQLLRLTYFKCALCVTGDIINVSLEDC